MGEVFRECLMDLMGDGEWLESWALPAVWLAV
jgi:hypothetical protein